MLALATLLKIKGKVKKHVSQYDELEAITWNYTITDNTIEINLAKQKYRLKIFKN